jgi:phage baseplate assembly protein W
MGYKMIEITHSTLSSKLDGYAVTAEDSFVDALTTLKGSVIGNPEYGTILPKLKHKPFNNSWIIDFKRCLKDACKHDPRLEFKSAIIDDSNVAEGSISFIVSFGYYTLEGVVNV